MKDWILNTVSYTHLDVYKRQGLYRSEKENLDEVFGCLKNEYYEEIMLRGMLIGLCKNPDREKFFSMIEEFVPHIRNWGICDVFCGGLKEVKKYKKETYDFLKKYLSSEREFDVRFALVMLTGYYIDEEYIDLSLIHIFIFRCKCGIRFQLSVGHGEEQLRVFRRRTYF